MDLPVTNDQKDVAATGHCYDAAFMEYAVLSNTLSARAIIQILLDNLPIASVLDVGCATGTWLKEWKACGVADIHGVDGDYVKRDQLQISPTEFESHDLSLSFHLDRMFNLVQSLEVAEHLAAESASRFVESLTGHSRGLVLFSAAPPRTGRRVPHQ
jgi:2-polyprenyl-3-methyl-5-hydroxy-6-metoxy-1,4-benzoquinol methylase